MITNVVFDFGGVLLDWNPHYLFDNYFRDPQKCDHFLREICNSEWNSQMDAGKSVSQGVAERCALFPEWEKEIRIYFCGWYKMMGGEIPGMYSLECELRRLGFGIYGVTNWAAETFATVEDRRVLRILDGYVVSGREKLLKPDKAIYKKLCSRYSLNPEDCVFVDDVPANVEGARRAGMEGIVFTGAADLRRSLKEMGVKISL